MNQNDVVKLIASIKGQLQSHLNPFASPMSLSRLMQDNPSFSDQSFLPSMDTINHAADDNNDFNQNDRLSNGSKLVNQLRKRIESDQLLPRVDLSDGILYRFLQSKSFDLDKTVEKLCNYVKMVNGRPELFTIPVDARKVFEQDIVNVPLVRNVNGEYLDFIRVGCWDPSEIDILTVIQSTIFYGECLALNPDIRDKGLRVVIDVTGLNWKQILNCGGSNAKLISDLTEKCMPVKFVNYHVVHENRWVNFCYAIFKSFLDDEITSRIIFHGDDLDSLHEYIPRKLLPAYLGGPDDGSIIFDGTKVFEEAIRNKKAILNHWDNMKSKF